MAAGKRGDFMNHDFPSFFRGGEIPKVQFYNSNLTNQHFSLTGKKEGGFRYHDLIFPFPMFKERKFPSLDLTEKLYRYKTDRGLKITIFSFPSLFLKRGNPKDKLKET